MKLPIQGVLLPVRLVYDPPLTDDELLELSAGNDVVWIEREPPTSASLFVSGRNAMGAGTVTAVLAGFCRMAPCVARAKHGWSKSGWPR